MTRQCIRPSTVSLFGNGQLQILLACLLVKGYPRIEVVTDLDTLALGQANPRLLTADNEAVIMSAI